ncbi:Caffeoyl-CoA O-methyltransferase [Cyphellophora attinorum]|uniref:Caffeoyl-CoA O-methyltransferase n=1 Tax=Cyphellophora attinorum TaxID=1664694 RepID=A0A0N0NI65_9EURO|nr:Caffeoyl-CoA O-methyltransferase [Phialophora attinorum]KPI35079.1 Caffeoyl-CoA O-methyltransferase [Phialophora attinorum]
MSIENVKHAEAVDAYSQSNLISTTEGEALDHAYSNSSKNGIPEIALSPVQGKFLNVLATMSGAKNVLELGTLGGYSGIWLARAVSKHGGKVTSIEIDPKRRDVATENLEYAGVGDDVEILLGPGLEVLPRIAKEIEDGKRERFDFTFIDADWENQYTYLDWAVKLSKKGSAIYVDNVVRQMLESGIVGDEKRDPEADDLVALTGKDDRVEATLIQTVGAKDYDGFLLAVVR